MAETALSETRPSWFQRLRNHIMGEDVFVSYSRQDATAYAFALAHALTRRRLACYLDQLGSPPGAEIPEEVLRKAERCQVFVLIATQHAKGSDAVHKELARFLPTRRALIPVNVDGALQEATWYPHVRGVAEAREAGAIVLEGRPSEALLDRIETAVGYNRRSRRITRAALVTVALVGLVTLAATTFSGIQAAHARKAEQEQAKAVRLRDEARTAEAGARAAAGEARTAAEEANAAREQAIAAKATADRDAAEARARAQEARQAAEHARKRGQALRLAAAARQQLPFDPKLGVQLAEAAVRASEPPMDEAVAVLRQALASDHEAAVLRRFPEEGVDLAVAPDGRRIALASGATIEVVGLDGERLCPPFTVKDMPKSMALSQGLLAAGGWEGVDLWDVRTCEALPMSFKPRDVEKVRFAPDETLLVLTRGHILHMRKGSEWSTTPLTREGQPMGSVAVSPDGRVAVAATYDGRLSVLQLPGGRPVELSLPPWEGSFMDLLISPDSRVAALFRGLEVLLIDLEKAEVLHRLEHGGTLGAAFSPDSALLAIAGWGAPTRILHVESGREVAALGPSNEAHKSVTFDSRGALLAVYDGSRVIRLFSRRETGAWGPLAELRGHLQNVQRVFFLPGGDQVLSAGTDGSVRLWNSSPSPGTRTKLATEGELKGARFSPDKGLLLTWDKHVRLYEVTSGRLLGPEALPPDDTWVGAGFSKDASILGMKATGSVCDSGRGGGCQPLLQPRGALTSAVPGPAGTWAGIRYDGLVFSSSGQELWNHAGTHLAFSPLEDLLAVATRSAYGLLWRPRAGGPPSRLVGHALPIHAFAFSPDGRQLLTGSTDNTARIWTVAGARPGAELHPDRLLLGHDNVVAAVAFNRDGTQAVTASWDGSVRVWETATGNPIQTLTFPERRFIAVAFLPGGRIASVTADGVLRVTPCELCVGAPELLELARRRRAARLTAREVEAVAGDLAR